MIETKEPMESLDINDPSYETLQALFASISSSLEEIRKQSAAALAELARHMNAGAA